LTFDETCIEGAFIVEPEPRGDQRGRFARVWCAAEFADHGIHATWVQANAGFSTKRGTLRGLHFQLAPAAEAKLVRCTRGALFDVVVDMREDSPTRHRWFGAELTEDNSRSVYMPEGCAHGYLTLRPATELSYLTSASYAPELERGVRYDDPLLQIAWPAEPDVISERDAAWQWLDRSAQPEKPH
jgi:dTDP-4-dehydrorhamnose 3,5-epimerase